MIDRCPQCKSMDKNKAIRTEDKSIQGVYGCWPGHIHAWHALTVLPCERSLVKDFPEESRAYVQSDTVSLIRAAFHMVDPLSPTHDPDNYDKKWALDRLRRALQRFDWHYRGGARFRYPTSKRCSHCQDRKEIYCDKPDCCKGAHKLGACTYCKGKP